VRDGLGRETHVQHIRCIAALSLAALSPPRPRNRLTAAPWLLAAVATQARTVIVRLGLLVARWEALLCVARGLARSGCERIWGCCVLCCSLIVVVMLIASSVESQLNYEVGGGGVH